MSALSEVTQQEPAARPLSLTGGADGEMDLDILKSIPKAFAVDSAERANWMVRKVMDARQYAAQVKAWAEQELARANREEQTLLYLFGRQIEQWTKGELAQLNGRRKSIHLPAGCIGFRTSPTRLVVDDEKQVISWAKENLPVAVVSVEKLSKTTLNEYAERTGVIPDGGVHVEPQAEKFFIR